MPKKQTKIVTSENNSAPLGTKENMYCCNRKCPYIDCLRWYRNIPFDRLIWEENYKFSENGCDHYET